MSLTQQSKIWLPFRGYIPVESLKFWNFDSLMSLTNQSIKTIAIHNQLFRTYFFYLQYSTLSTAILPHILFSSDYPFKMLPEFMTKTAFTPRSNLEASHKIVLAYSIYESWVQTSLHHEKNILVKLVAKSNSIRNTFAYRIMKQHLVTLSPLKTT